jgi:1-deoxy-D-xylulose-5-phosphate synthase
VSDAVTVVRFPKGALGPSIAALRVEDGYDVIAESGCPDVVIVAIGAFAALCIDVAERLKAQGIGVLVVDPRWVKPVPVSLVPLAAAAELVVVVEDGVRVGGVGSAVSQLLRDSGVEVPVSMIGVPDRFLDQGKRAEVLAECGLTAQDISRTIVETMARRVEAESPADEPAEQPTEGTFTPS